MFHFMKAVLLLIFFGLFLGIVKSSYALENLMVVSSSLEKICLELDLDTAPESLQIKCKVLNLKQNYNYIFNKYNDLNAEYHSEKLTQSEMKMNFQIQNYLASILNELTLKIEEFEQKLLPKK